jgi:hypothetical protein
LKVSKTSLFIFPPSKVGKIMARAQIRRGKALSSVEQCIVLPCKRKILFRINAQCTGFEKWLAMVIEAGGLGFGLAANSCCTLLAGLHRRRMKKGLTVIRCSSILSIFSIS